MRARLTVRREPPRPFAGVPGRVLIGAVKEAAMVVEGQIIARRQLAITATIDHRFMDGAQGATLAKTMRELMELEGRDRPP